MSKRSKKRISLLGSRVTSVISVGLVLIILGLIGLTWIIGRTVTTEFKQNLGLHVVVSTEADSAAVGKLDIELGTAPYARQITFISADSILKEESAALGEDIVGLAGINPFNPEYEILVTEPYANPDSISAICGRLSKHPAVVEAVSHLPELKGVFNNLDSIMLILLCVAIALTAISVALINNTVYLSVYSRRFIINTMRLVGASRGFVRAPFVKAGAMTGLFGAMTACIVLAGLTSWSVSAGYIQSNLLPIFPCCMLGVIIMLLGPAICAMAAALATNRYLSANYDEMFN